MLNRSKPDMKVDFTSMKAQDFQVIAFKLTKFSAFMVFLQKLKIKYLYKSNFENRIFVILLQPERYSLTFKNFSITLEYMYNSYDNTLSFDLNVLKKNLNIQTRSQ